jgi:phosphinothricin acetyltransferase
MPEGAFMLRAATLDDLPEILDIYNDAVLHTTAIWNDAVVDLDNRRAWFIDRQARNYPILVAEDAGKIAGYASFGDFRPFDGYRFSVEHSVYVAEPNRRRGFGRALVQGLYEPARKLHKRVMIAGIAGDNAGSLKLHANLGFVETGRMRGVGTKFGKLLDLVFVQKEL